MHRLGHYNEKVGRYGLARRAPSSWSGNHRIVARKATHPKAIARRAWLASLMLHAAALAVLFATISIQNHSGPRPDKRIVVQAEVRDIPASDSEANVQLEERGAERRENQASRSDWDPVMRSAQSPEATASAESKTFLQKQIDRSIQSSQQRSSEDNLDRLSQLSRDLRRNSRAQSIDEMAGFLGGMVPKRVTTPVEDSESRPFEAETAQLHDVLKSDGADGKVQYTAVMIDAHGVLRSVEMDAETGKQLYRTMQLIRSNPLLEQVYRKIVMGILDQVLKDAEATP